MKIALDAMGGDNGPPINIEGAIEAVREWPDVKVVLVGDEAAIGKELAGKKYPSGKIEILHASEVIEMHEHVSQTLRKKKDSSIRRAIELVKAGGADAAVSAGHSGATMALALLTLRPSAGVDRPAIATVMPTYYKPFVLIDAGANVDCTAKNILQFAYMADAYAKLILDRPSPRVGLLSIGEEESKGNELTKEAYNLLKKSGLNFIGNVEGKEIFMGGADVVACDGFIGNIFLKTSEGLADVAIKMLKREITSLRTAKLGYFLMKPAFQNFRKQTDYSEYGGAPLLGLNGTCVISHGRSTPKAIKNAIRVANEFSGKRVYEAIAAEIAGHAV